MKEQDIDRNRKLGMIANFVTILRIVFSILMLCFPTLSSGFYFCYLLAGISDMVDGTIARFFGTESEFGEKLDTIADIIFVAVALYKLLPVIVLNTGIWIWTGIVAAIKVINLIYGFVTQRRFVTIHSWANKLTGLALFVLPFSLSIIDIKYSSILICLLATFAAIQEGRFIRTKEIE